MRITQEADYALRICAALSQTEHPIASTHLSEKLCVPQRFASKILRELMLAGIVSSTRGINGGFKLAKEPENISLKSIIESIDGPIAIRHCLLRSHECAYQKKNKSKCRFHIIFEELNNIITSRLDKITLADMVNSDIPIDVLVTDLYKF